MPPLKASTGYELITVGTGAPFPSMGVFHGAGKVHDGEQEKYEGLHQGNENTQSHDRQGRKKRSGQGKQDTKQRFLCHDVSEY